MPIIEAILYFCEECKTVSLDGGICIQCGEPLMVDTFVPKAAQQGVHRTALQVRILNAICYGITAGTLLWLLFGRR